MGSAIDNGTIYSDVAFVHSEDEASVIIDYNKVEYSEKDMAWLYYNNGYLVAIRRECE